MNAPSPKVSNSDDDLREVPPDQPEHYLAVLGGLCRAHWLALLVVVLVAFWIRASSSLHWPQTGYFTELYVLIALEYGLANLCLTLALQFRGWYERTPRAKLNRLRQLTLLVLLWDGLHVLGAMLVFGGLNGPLTPLVPLLVLAGFVMLPQAHALRFALGVLVVLSLATALQYFEFLHPEGALGATLRVMPDSIPLNFLMILAISLPAIVVGSGVRERLERAFHGQHPVNLMDARFGCFTPASLERRCGEELRRGQQHGSPTSLMLIQVGNTAELLQNDGLDGIEIVLSRLAEIMKTQTRLDLDTWAYRGNACFGVLLPTASSEAAAAVQRRIVNSAGLLIPQARLGIGLVTVAARDPNLTVAAWIAACEAELAADLQT